MDRKWPGNGLKADWKQTGSGLEAEWKWTGSGMEADWKRTGSGQEEDWKHILALVPMLLFEGLLQIIKSSFYEIKL